MSDTAAATAESSIQECTAHLQWIQRARSSLADLFPLTAATLASLAEHDVERLDQLIYRFMKMQDSMARRLLPSIFAILDGRSEPTPFLDILNRLEALSVIPSAEIWQFFRVLRNNLAHDYPESVEQTVNTLNELFGRLPEFVALFESARDAVLDRLN